MAHSVTPPPANPSHEDIVWLAGPRLLGLLFNWGLLGLLTTQVYVYYLNFPKDRRFIKALVYSIYILDWAQTCSATYDGFQWFVYGWGDIAMLYGLESSYLNVPVFSSIIGAAVQIFFGWRIWTFSRSYAVFALIIFLALLQLGGGAAVAHFIIADPSEVSRSSGLVRAVAVRLGGSALVDTVIACSMTYYLLRSRERAVGHLNNVLTRLVRLTVETGTVTALAAIVDLVFFVSLHNGMHQVSGVILGKLYSNTLLVIFNNRMIMATKGLYQSDLPMARAAHQHSSNDRSLTVDPEAGQDTVDLKVGKASEGFVSSPTSTTDWR